MWQVKNFAHWARNLATECAQERQKAITTRRKELGHKL